MQGIRVVKAFTLEPFMRARQGEAIASFERAANKLSTVGARSSPLTETLGGVAIAIVVVYGGLKRHRDGTAAGQFLRLHHRADAGLRAGQARRAACRSTSPRR